MNELRSECVVSTDRKASHAAITECRDDRAPAAQRAYQHQCTQRHERDDRRQVNMHRAAVKEPQRERAKHRKSEREHHHRHEHLGDKALRHEAKRGSERSDVFAGEANHSNVVLKLLERVSAEPQVADSSHSIQKYEDATSVRPVTTFAFCPSAANVRSFSEYLPSSA